MNVKYNELERLKIGKDVFEALLNAENKKVIMYDTASKYNLSVDCVEAYLGAYRKRKIEPMPSQVELDIYNKKFGKSELSLDDRIAIGKEIFDALVKDGYGKNVKENIAEKYGLSLSFANKLLREYKERVVDPRPSFEDLKQLEKNYNENLYSFKLAESLLTASDEELKYMIEKYGMVFLLKKIDSYIKFKSDDFVNIAKLKEIRLKLSDINNVRLNEKKIINEEKREEKKEELYNGLINNTISSDNKLNVVVNAIREYISGDDYYPNYIFRKKGITSNHLSKYLKSLKDSGKKELVSLVSEYFDVLAVRELEFAALITDVVNLIEEKNPNILDFYRLTHMSINKFKTFLRVSIVRRSVSSYTEGVINNFLERYIIGSVGISNLDEALDIFYEYNGVLMTSADIKDICIDLFNNNIPINKNSIVFSFEEKVKNKMNKM